jgi:hypothetical protein
VLGAALYNVDRQLIWGQAANDLEMGEGAHELTYQFPMLPLKPGPYTWYVTLWEDDALLDECDLIPELLVATENHQHARDEWSGHLNVPSRFEIHNVR